MRWIIALVALASVAGCVQSDSVACADGTVCPRDRSCRLIVDSYQCVSDEQVAACDGKPDLAMCAGGTCLGGACLPPSCGDGTIDPVEVCDDSNATGGDGCAADCRSDESCGNGVVDLTVGEECDDGPAARGLSRDGCSSTCRRERPTWKNLPDYDELFGPGGRVGVAYDTTRGRVVVIGRSASSLVTVEYDAGVWSVATPTVAPSDRPGFDLAYDSERRRLVMFGGFGLRDTWEWDGARWELRAPATSPPARSGAAMAYDPLGHRVVMFGGRTNLISTNSEIADTWAWDGRRSPQWRSIRGASTRSSARSTAAACCGSACPGTSPCAIRSRGSAGTRRPRRRSARVARTSTGMASCSPPAAAGTPIAGSCARRCARRARAARQTRPAAVMARAIVRARAAGPAPRTAARAR